MNIDGDDIAKMISGATRKNALVVEQVHSMTRLRVEVGYCESYPPVSRESLLVAALEDVSGEEEAAEWLRGRGYTVTKD